MDAGNISSLEPVAGLAAYRASRVQKLGTSSKNVPRVPNIVTHHDLATADSFDGCICYLRSTGSGPAAYLYEELVKRNISCIGVPCDEKEPNAMAQEIVNR